MNPPKTSPPGFGAFGCLVFGGLTFSCCAPVAAFLEAAALGPYTAWYNQRKLAEATLLIGGPSARVEAVLGRASNAYTFPAAHIVDHTGKVVRVVGRPGQTFEYYPYPFLPMSKFQVHCHGGIVSSLEMYDD
jgi:hypothetical protein